MNIIFLLNSTFPYYSGGRENWLFHVSKKLIYHDHTVYAMTINPGKHAAKHYDPDPGLKLVQVFVPFYNGIGGKVLRGPLRLLKSACVFLSFRVNLARMERQICDPKVIITLDTIVTPLAINSELRRRVVYVCANKGPHAEVMANRLKILRPLFFKLEQRAYELADEVWANGYDMEAYIDQQGYASIMVGNGIDSRSWDDECPIPPEFGSLMNRKKITCIGTVLPIKGVSEAIQAIAKLSLTEGDVWDLVWVGKGDRSTYLEKARTNGVLEHVHFIGARKDVRPYAKHADVLLCLSGGGGISMAALECMASSVPVVAWDTPVYRQIIRDGVSGFLVPYNDVDGLASSIKRAANLPEAQKETITKNAKEVAFSHDWEGVVSKIESRLVDLSK